MKQSERYPDQSGWDKIITPITLKMKKGVWEMFKEITPRSIKLNDAIVQLITKEIVKDSEDVTTEEVDKFMKDQNYWAKKKAKKKS